jgi:beta-glucosidase
MGHAIGVESRATHNAQADKSGNDCGSDSTGKSVSNGCGITLYAPNINIVRDPRWGRAEEVYGEDPFLTSELAVGMVTGMQGNKEGEPLGADGSPLISGASCKHFAVYQNENIPEERTTLDANVSARSLWETYLPMMKACVMRGKATHVMCSYNAVNGKPTCAHPELLNDILRDSWGFDGFVVSDYDAWKNLVDTHHFAATYAEAAAIGINNGMDQEGGFGQYSPIDAMPDALAAGNVSEATIEQSFRRLMRVRMRLGMFDPPSMVPAYNSSYLPDQQCETEERLELARRAARDGAVLLKNANLKGGNAALPLSRLGQDDTVAVVGPQALDWRVLVGASNYAFRDGPSTGVVTLLEGLKSGAGSMQVVHANGCDTASCETVDISSATTIATNSAATVVILGDWFGNRDGWPLCKGTGEDGCEAEAHDRTAIELPGKQVELVQALRDSIDATNEASVPLVCVLLHGGAVALGDALHACDAIVDMWVPGQMGGAALADIIFGDFSPAGRLPITMYSATTDLPPMDKAQFDEYPNEKSNGTTYRHYVGPAPAFRFGHGLSYTKFSYPSVDVQRSAGPCEPVHVSVTVHNVGKYVSDEVVQVYVSTPESTEPSPRIRLAAFKRVKNIQPGQSVNVDLVIAPESHSVVIPAESVYIEQLKVEAGNFKVYVGGSQPEDDAAWSVVSITGSSMMHACNAVMI